jgi:hypothetical protein
MTVGLQDLPTSMHHQWEHRPVTEAYASKHFSVGLPVDDPDQSLTALFRHVAAVLAQDEPISMDDVLAVSFGTDLSDDGEWHGHFTIVFSPDDDASSRS